MPPCLEHSAQLEVIEDFAVVCDPDVLALVVDRLSTAVQVDDAQPSVPQIDPMLDMKPSAVRAAMPESRDHALKHLEIGRLARCVIAAGHSTHKSSERVLDRSSFSQTEARSGVTRFRSATPCGAYTPLTSALNGNRSDTQLRHLLQVRLEHLAHGRKIEVP